MKKKETTRQERVAEKRAKEVQASSSSKKATRPTALPIKSSFINLLAFLAHVAPVNSRPTTSSFQLFIPINENFTLQTLQDFVASQLNSQTLSPSMQIAVGRLQGFVNKATRDFKKESDHVREVKEYCTQQAGNQTKQLEDLHSTVINYQGELALNAMIIATCNKNLDNCLGSATPADQQCNATQQLEKLEKNATTTAVADQQRSVKLVQRKKYRHHNAAHRHRKAAYR